MQSKDYLHTPEASDKSPAATIRALERGLGVLSLFDEAHPTWSTGEIVRASHLDRATVFRILATLERTGYLGLDLSSRRYHLGPALLSPVYALRSHEEFVDIARPYIQRLALETGETVNLAVPLDGRLVLMEQVKTSRPFDDGVWKGRMLRGLANVHGKVYAAFSGVGDRERMLSEPQSERTSNTITDRARLEQVLDQVAVEGVAYDFEEYRPGVRAVGAPVFGQSGDVKASVSVVGPAGRFTQEKLAEFKTLITRMAGEFSAFLGYLPRE